MKRGLFISFQKRSCRRVVAVAINLLALAAYVTPAWAASGTFTGTNSGTWTDSGNWSAAFPNALTDLATFNSAGNGNTTLTLGQDISILGIFFDTGSCSAYTFSAGNQFSLANGGTIGINSGVTTSPVFNTPLQLGDSGTTATYTLANASTLSALTFNGNITGGSGGTAGTKTLAVAATGSITVGGSISNGGGTIALTKTGAGTLTLSGANTYSGATAISGGMLEFQGAAAMSSSSALTIGNGATLSLRSDAATTFAPASLGAFNPGSTYNIQVNSLTPAGNGNTFTLTGQTGASASGTTTVNVSSTTGDTLKFGSSAYALSGNSGTAFGGDNNVFNLTGANVILNGLNDAAGNSDVYLTLASTTGNSLTINGVVTANNNRTIGAIVNSGILNLNNTVSANTGQPNWGFWVNLNGGTLNLQTAGAINNNDASAHPGSNGFIIAGGNLDNTSGGSMTLTASTGMGIGFNGDFTFVGSSGLNLGANAVTLGGSGSSRQVTVTANTLTVGGTISGGYGLTKTGAGTLFLSGNNGYTGNTAINNGMLLTAKAASLPGYGNTGSVTVNGGMLGVQIGGAGWTTTQVDTLLSNATKTSGSLGIDTTNASLTQWTTFTASTFGGLGLTKLGANTLTLTYANTFTGGASISGGMLTLANTAAVGSGGSTIYVSTPTGAGTLRLATDTSVNAYRIATSSSNAGTIISDVATPGNAAITHVLGTASLGNNTLNITTGPNATGTGTISLDSVGLTGGAAGTTILNPTTANLVVVNGASITANNFAKILQLDGTSSGNSIGGVIQNGLNTLSLTKANTSTWTLYGNNTYTGATTISGGTLKAGSSTAFNNTSSLRMTGGTLDINGNNATFTNGASVTAGTVINNGAQAGTISITALSAGMGALFQDGTSPLVVSVVATGNNFTPLTNASNTFSGGVTLGNNVRMGNFSNSATTGGLLGKGTITLNGSAQLYYSSGANYTISNNIVVNGNAGNGGRSGCFRIDGLGTPTTLTLSGALTANVDAYFEDGTGNATGIAVLTGQVTGPAGIQIHATSNKETVVLQNAAQNNNFAGNITFASGNTTLKLGASNQTPNGTGKGVVAFGANAGTFDLNGFSTTINGLTGTAGAVDNVAGGGTSTLTVGAGDTSSSFSGLIKNTTGTVNLAKIGSGTQTLTGANTYIGATTINGGTLLLNFAAGTANSIIASGSALVLGGGALSANGTLAAGNSQTFNGTTFNAGYSTITETGTITLKLGALTRNVGGVVDFTIPATSTITASYGSSANGIIGPWATVAGSNWATINAGGNVGSFTSYTDINHGGTLTDGSATNVRINGGTTGNVALGSATTTVNTLLQNTGTAGTVSTAGGTLAAGGVMIGAGRQALTLGASAGDGFLMASAAGGELGLINNSGSVGTVNAVITDNGSASSLTKSGTGMWVLNGVNTYTGATSIGAGTLSIGGSGQLNSGTYNANIINNGNMIYGSSANQTLGGNLSGTGTLTKVGAGSLTLAGTGGVGGHFFVQGGAVNVTGSFTAFGKATLSGNSTLNWSGTGTLGSSANEYVGIGDQTAGTLNLTTGSLTLTPKTTFAFFIGNNAAAAVNVSGGTLSLNNTAGLYLGSGYNNNGGGTGTLTVSGGVFTTGATTGVFQLGSSGTTTGIGTVNLDGGVLSTLRSITKGGGGSFTTAVFNFNGGTFQATGNNGTFMQGLTAANVRNGGAIIDSGTYSVTIGQNLVHSTIGSDNATDGGLTKFGAGTLTLSGTSTYTGATTINNGKLLVNGALNGAGTVTVSGGGLLGGTGVVAGLIVVDTGTLSPGNSVGTLTAGSSGVTLNSGAVFLVELSNTQSDLLQMSGGTLTLNSPTLALAPGSVGTAGSFTVISGYSAKAGTFSNSTVTDDNSTVYNIIYSDTAVTLTVIPEPFAAGLLLLGLGALLIGRRRKV